MIPKPKTFSEAPKGVCDVSRAVRQGGCIHCLGGLDHSDVIRGELISVSRMNNHLLQADFRRCWVGVEVHRVDDCAAGRSRVDMPTTQCAAVTIHLVEIAVPPHRYC